MSAPEPMTPPDCDLRGYEYMPLFGQKLFGSNLYAEATDEEFRAALKLWWEAWQQCPAGSLPSSDQAIARLADYGRDPKGWARIRENALHGFVLCADGRLYHPMLSEAAIKAYELRLKSDRRRETDRKRLQAWREARRIAAEGNASDGSGNGGGNSTGNDDETRFNAGNETRVETPSETHDETRYQMRRREGKEEKKEEPPVRPPLPAEAPRAASPTNRAVGRGHRLPKDWQPSEDLALFARQHGLDPKFAAAEFRDYWHGVAGAKGVKLDWDGTFRNSCRRRAKCLPSPQRATTVTATGRETWAIMPGGL